MPPPAPAVAPPPPLTPLPALPPAPPVAPAPLAPPTAAPPDGFAAPPAPLPEPPALPIGPGASSGVPHAAANNPASASSARGSTVRLGGIVLMAESHPSRLIRAKYRPPAASSQLSLKSSGLRAAVHATSCLGLFDRV